MERWGLGLALPGGRPREHLVRAGYLTRASTLRELAAKLKIDADGLEASARRFGVFGHALVAGMLVLGLAVVALYSLPSSGGLLK